MQQIRLPLFYNLQEIIRNSDFHRKYHLIFQSLNLSEVRDINNGVGRTGYSRHAMLRAFIVKHLEQIKSVPRLIEFLDAHPGLTEMCGFDMGNLPNASQFYKFLTGTNTSVIEKLHHAVNQKLIDQNLVSLSCFIMDSKPRYARIPRNSAFFKQTFNLRTEVERYFSRLGDREVEQTTHYKMRAIRNQMTIAHLSMSLVAHAAAILLDQPEKIRCFRTFALNSPPLARAS